MDHTVEMDQLTFAAARRVMAFAELKSVRLLKCTMNTQTQATLSAKNIPLELKTRTSAKKTSDTEFISTFHFHVSTLQDGSERKRLEVSVDFEVLYAFPSDQRLSNVQLRAFTSTNGMLNVWPFWREMVQSLTVRAGLPPLTLPLLRIQHIRPKVAAPVE